VRGAKSSHGRVWCGFAIGGSAAAPGCRLALGEQVLGHIGLSLKPGQSWLLVYPGHLAGGEPSAHDRDDLAVGGRLLLPAPRWASGSGGADLGAGHYGIGAAAVAPCGLAVGTYQHREQALDLVNGLSVAPKKEQCITPAPYRVCVRLMGTGRVVSKGSKCYPQPGGEAWRSAIEVVASGHVSGSFDGLAHEPRRHGVQLACVVFTGRSGGSGGVIVVPPGRSGRP
jgi:hypothetical protein